MPLEDYLLYAGMFQGEMLAYALEAMRITKNNYGGLIWSYNDAYGEIGWSIIDYYLTRKISYHFVKRAFAHQKLILREENRAEGKVIQVLCVNDTNAPMEFKLEYGYTSFDGKRTDASKTNVTVPAFAKAAVIAQFARGEHDSLKGVFFAKSLDRESDLLPAILHTTDFKNLQLEKPVFKITGWEEARNEDDGESVYEKSKYMIKFTVTSDQYAHGVHFGLPDDVLLSDEYFDLLPGERREITITAGWTEPSRREVQAIWEKRAVAVESV
jgi:beta-mannosidase